MSKLCLVIFKCLHEEVELRSRVQEILHTKNFALFDRISYCEPFLSEFFCEDKIMYSIADTYDYDNCEMLLLPDSCFYNGRSNPVLFQERIRLLQNVLYVILEHSETVDVFIGDSGLTFSEFIHYDTKIENFLPIAETLNTVVPKDIHITITL